MIARSSMQRNWLTAIVLGLMAFTDHPATAQSSVTFQINAEHTGAARFAQGFKAPLQRVWSRTLGETYVRYPTRISYPVIANGRVFVIVAAVSPSQDRRLFALSAANGEILWSKRVDHRMSPPTLALGTDHLFVVTGGGRVQALDPGTGTQLWTTVLKDQYHFRHPPTPRGQRLYIGGSGSGGTLFALNQRTGRLIWKQNLITQFFGSPTVTKDAVFMAYPGGLYKFASGTGALSWHQRFPGGGGGGTAPVYSNVMYALVYASVEENPISLFDTGSGQYLTKIPGIHRPPAFSGGVGYFAKLDRLIAWDVTTRQTLWEFTGAQAPALPALVVNDKVIVASHGGDLFVVDRKSGVELQRIPLGAEIPFNLEHDEPLRTGMAAGEGLLIVPTSDTLTAFRGAQ